MDNTSGRRWARFALIFGAVMSILGNEAHTVLTDSPVSLLLRMVLAFIWPAGLFVAVEVFVRVNWRPKFIDYAARFVMMGPVSTVAAVVSYQHLHSLMLLGSEDWFSAMIGPVAIDGLMIGGTVALLAIRAATIAPAGDASAAMERLEKVAQEQEDWSRAAEMELAQEIESEQEKQIRPAAPRVSRSLWDAAKTIEMIVDGAKDVDVKATTGASPTTSGRLRKVTKMLRADPRAAVDPKVEKVLPEHIAMIRELVSK